MENSEILDIWNKETPFKEWRKTLIAHQDPSNPEKCDLELIKKEMPHSDVMVARFLLKEVGDRISWSERDGYWHVWNGLVHVPLQGNSFVSLLINSFLDEFAVALDIMEKYVQSLVNAATASGRAEDHIKSLKKLYTDGLKRQREYRDKVANSSGNSSVINSLKPMVTKTDDYFDHDEGYLVTRNCVINLDKLRAGDNNFVENHSPKYPVTRYMDLDYNPTLGEDAITDSHWMKFLESSLGSTADKYEVLGYVQKVLGASFMGTSKMRTILNFIGPPSSGKSLFLEAIWRLSRDGEGYCLMGANNALVKAPSGGANFEQDTFRGKRFIAVSEPDSSAQADDYFLKTFTGDEAVTSRTLHAKSSSWKPQGCIFVGSNNLMRISTRDKAIVERIKQITFPYEFVQHPDPNNPKQKQRDPELADKLSTERERSIILNWIILGMYSYLESGMDLTAPESVVAAQQKILTTGSITLRWLHDQLEDKVLVKVTDTTSVQANGWITLDDCYQNFRFWAADNQERSIAKRFFIEDLEKDFEIGRYAGKKIVIGLQKTLTSTYTSDKDAEMAMKEAGLA